MKEADNQVKECKVSHIRTLSAVALLGLAVCLPTSTEAAVNLTSGNVGSSFTIFFDGNVNTNPVPGLTSEAKFTLTGVDNTVLSSTVTEYSFTVALKNTSSGGITSRASALGFNANPNLIGVGTAGGTGSTRVSGVFTNDRAGAFPNQFGNVELCITNGNTCQGGAGGGVSTGSTGTATLVLAFSNNVSSISMDNFGVRYQSITGTTFGTPGTGVGVVPLPAAAWLFGSAFVGLCWLGRRAATGPVGTLPS